MAEQYRILTYAPWSLNGRGPGQTCVWLVSDFPRGPRAPNSTHRAPAFRSHRDWSPTRVFRQASASYLGQWSRTSDFDALT